MDRVQAVNHPSRGCVGSIQWGIDTGRAYDVKGIFQYGRTLPDADSHAHALEIALSWDCSWNDEAFTFIAPPVLEVLRVGPKYDYMRSDLRRFVLVNGRVASLVRCQTCGDGYEPVMNGICPDCEGRY